ADGPADGTGRLQYHHVPARVGEQVRGHEPVVPCPDDDSINGCHQKVRRYSAQPRHTVGGSIPASRARKSRYASPYQTSANDCVVRSPRATRSSPITMQQGCTTPALVT